MLSRRRRRLHPHQVENYLYTHWTGCPNCALDPVRLYDGISNRPDARSDQHAASKLYWPLVRVIVVEPMWGMTREETEAEESARIRKHRAPFNNKDNPSFRRQELDRARLVGSVTPMVVVRTTKAWARHLAFLVWVALAWVLTVVFAVILLS